MPNFNNYYGVPNGYPVNPNGIPQAGQAYYGIPQQSLPLVYVHGREGANAYQLPPGITKQILWDDEDDRFYIKSLDEYGRPKIVADNDFCPHVEAIKPSTTNNPSENIDFSVYPTKKELEDFLSKYDTSKYLTKNDLDEALKNLSFSWNNREG